MGLPGQPSHRRCYNLETGGPGPAFRVMGGKATGQLVGGSQLLPADPATFPNVCAPPGQATGGGEGQEPTTPATVHGPEERGHLATPSR